MTAKPIAWARWLFPVPELPSGGVLEQDLQPLATLEQAQPAQMLLQAFELSCLLEDLQPALSPEDLHRLPHQGEGHRVTVGLEADQVVLGHDTRLPGLQPEAGVAGGRHEVALLGRKAIEGALVGGPMNAPVGDLSHQLAHLLLEIHVVDERAAGQEVAGEVLHTRFDLALLESCRVQSVPLIRRRF
jgi:hypothetical protein